MVNIDKCFKTDKGEITVLNFILILANSCNLMKKIFPVKSK